MSLILTLLAALAAAWAHGVAPRVPRPGLRLALRAFLVGSLATAAALALASRGTLAPFRPALLGLGAASAMVAWAGLIRLVSFETRPRDLVGRFLCLGLAALSSASGWAPGLTASLALSGTMVWRWKRELPTRSRFTLGMIALALGVTLSTHWGHVFPPGVLADVPKAWHAFARTVLMTSTFYALFGAVSLLRAWASDPSLGIRRVSRRLVLSHVLVGLVPVLLIGTMWTVTTILGVLNERAIVGALAIAAQGRWYRSLLTAGLAHPGRNGDGLAGLAGAVDSSATVDSASAVRVWHRSGAVFRRVAGPPVAGEEHLAAWLDSLVRLPATGIVSLGGTKFLGAAAMGPDAAGAILLAPLPAALRSLPDSVARAELSIWEEGVVRTGPAGVTLDGEGSTAGDSAASEAWEAGVAEDSLSAANDSAAVAGIRRTLRRFGVPDRAIQTSRGSRRGSAARFSSGGETIDLAGGDRGFLMQGHAVAKGLKWSPTGWSATEFLLTARAAPSAVLSGLARDLNTNILGLIPVFVIGSFAVIALLVLAWDLLIVRGMGRSINQAVGALRGAAERLSAGDLSHRITIAGEDDLWQVATAFNTATEGLARARVAEQERQRAEDELDVARRIQERLLPAAVPRVRGLEIAGHYDPAREIGGDYYDHIALDDHRVLLVIADVSGKSVPAALIMAGFRAALVSQNLAEADMPALAGKLNGFLNDSLDSGKFVTAFLAVVDGASGQVTYVNAGHNPPVLLRADGRHELLEAGGTILGIMPATRYARGDTILSPGDLLVLYTDGVTEATSPSTELWGDERLIAMLRVRAQERCGELVRSIAREVRAFEGERGPTDDVTLIAARRTAG